MGGAESNVGGRESSSVSRREERADTWARLVSGRERREGGGKRRAGRAMLGHGEMGWLDRESRWAAGRRERAARERNRSGQLGGPERGGDDEFFLFFSF